jgi:NAD(P)-dependent dehydrogenase (short-subunit alcohol dehydrogenase family)
VPVTLKGKTAIIIGGGHGIGRVTAFTFAEAGANIVVAARSRFDIEKTANEASSRWGIKALAVPCDISRYETVSSLVTQTMERFAQLDIVVNTSGVLHPVKPVWKADPIQWQHNLTVNLIGTFHITKAALEPMIAARQGRIIHLSSIAAISPVFGWSAYCTAKAGIDHFVKVTAQEVFPYGIAIYSVWPGMVNTRMAEELFQVSPEDMGEENLSRFKGYREKGLLRPAHEPAQLILYLATVADLSLSGRVINLDDESIRKVVAKALNKPLIPGPQESR